MGTVLALRLCHSRFCLLGHLQQKQKQTFSISGSIFDVLLTQNVMVFSVGFTIASVQTVTWRNNGESHYNCSSWNVGPSQTVLTDTVHFIIIPCEWNLLLNITAKCVLCAVLSNTTLGHMFERKVSSSREYISALLVGMYVSNRLFKTSQVTICVWRFLLIFYFNACTVHFFIVYYNQQMHNSYHNSIYHNNLFV
jgi:hypothetical protein